MHDLKDADQHLPLRFFFWKTLLKSGPEIQSRPVLVVVDVGFV